MNQDKIRELEGKVVAVCASCPHAKWVTGRFECDRKRSPCHSKRVKKWLKEIERLVVEGETR